MSGRSIEHELIELIGGKRDKNGRLVPAKSYKSAYDNFHIARLIGRTLEKRFPDLQSIDELKGRHVTHLIRFWQGKELSVGTIENRMVVIRRIYEKLGKGHMILRTNAAYGIGTRPVRTVSRAVELDDGVLEQIQSRHRGAAERIRVSLRLMRYLGLRFEESVRIEPRHAVERDIEGRIIAVYMQGTWCKNGRERRIVLSSDIQREVLEDAILVAGAGSLIGRYYDLARWRSHFYYCCNKAGIRDRHALRHRYAQMRYEELTGKVAPIVAISRGEEVNLDWIDDDTARLIISSELGHRRKAVTDAYLGKRTIYDSDCDILCGRLVDPKNCEIGKTR